MRLAIKVNIECKLQLWNYQNAIFLKTYFVVEVSVSVLYVFSPGYEVNWGEATDSVATIHTLTHQELAHSVSHLSHSEPCAVSHLSHSEPRTVSHLSHSEPRTVSHLSHSEPHTISHLSHSEPCTVSHLSHSELSHTVSHPFHPETQTESHYSL